MQETRIDPSVKKIPWRRKWQPPQVFLPRKSYGERSLVGYSPWGLKESDCDWQTGWLTSVQFSRSVMSNSLQPHKLQHARPLCPSPTPGVYPNSFPSSRWYNPAISSSVVPFSSCPQSLPASESFPMSQLFSWGGQSIGVNASASVLLMDTQDWSPLNGLVGSPWSPRDSQEYSPTPKFKSINSLVLIFLHSPTLISIHHHWENHSLN